MWLNEVHIIVFVLCGKPTFRAIATKMSQATSWVFVRSLPWAQRKNWIPIGSMGCVHTHRRKPTIERCGSSSCV